MGTGAVAAALSPLASHTTQVGRSSACHASAEVEVAVPSAGDSKGLEGASAGEAAKTGGMA